MTVWTLVHFPDADLPMLAQALRKIDRSFALLTNKGTKHNFRHGEVHAIEVEGTDMLQDDVFDARWSDSWEGPNVKQQLSKMIDIIPGALGEDEKAIEGIYNPDAALQKAISEIFKKKGWKPVVDTLHDEAMKKAADMFTTSGRAGTVVVDPYARHPEDRYKVVAEDEVEALAQIEQQEAQAAKDEATKRADQTQDAQGTLPRPWESAWTAAIAGLSPRALELYEGIVATQVELSELAFDLEDQGEHTLVVFVPLKNPDYAGSMKTFYREFLPNTYSMQDRFILLPSIKIEDAEKGFLTEGATRRPMPKAFDPIA